MNVTKTKTDNAHLADKLELRRRILREMKAPLKVLDLFSGEGRIWAELGKEFKIAAYTPCDCNPRQSGAIRIRIDARTVAGFNPAAFNVIDIDSYGEPWEIWGAIAKRVATGTAVFLTHGHPNSITIGNRGVSHYLREVSGIPRDWKIPISLQLIDLLSRRCAARTLSAAQLALVVARPHQHYYGALL